MRRLLAVTTLVLLGAIITPGEAQADHPEFVADPSKEAEFVALINDLRRGQGLPTFEVHPELTAKARAWSHTMADADDIWHSHLPDGVTVDWKRLGENVGMGGSVQALHDAFVASPGHYENLIDPGFRHVGLGVTVDADGTIFVSEVFMELASQPAPPASSPGAGTPSSSEPSAPLAGAPAPSERVRNAPAAGAGGTAVPPETEPSPRLSSVLARLRAMDG